MSKVKKKYRRVLFWFRRDLRLDDNRALAKACEESECVIPIYIFEPSIQSLSNKHNEQRLSFIFESLAEINLQLHKQQSEILILEGQPHSLIPKIIDKLNAEALYFNREYEPQTKKRDSKISSILIKKGCSCYSFKDQVIFEGNELLTLSKQPYKVFTPYMRSWKKKLTADDYSEYKISRSSFKKISLPRNKKPNFKILINVNSPKGGTKTANKVLKEFLQRIDQYALLRNFPAQKGTSNLSPYLRYGCISIRKLIRQVSAKPSEGSSIWLNELIWREFYQMILDQFPYVEKQSYRASYRNIKWPGSKSHLQAWGEGKTGFPIIDAAMRCLVKTGNMHNRLRMICATFLVKDLLINWQEGERFFALHLLDYDLAANNGGWQWCASTGCDHQPYFRIFNPLSQSMKYDPEGKFIKQFCPELKHLPAKKIHWPSNLSIDEQKKFHCILGTDYPLPIVNHSEQIRRALLLYKP